jgi:hypothetical protein
MEYFALALSCTVRHLNRVVFVCLVLFDHKAALEFLKLVELLHYVVDNNLVALQLVDYLLLLLAS